MVVQGLIKKAIRHARMKISMFVYPRRRLRIRHAATERFDLLVPVNEDVGRQIYVCGEYETQDALVFVKAVKPGDVCVDVGANVGYYSMLLTRLASAGAVHAFEPIPLNYHLLRASQEINGVHNLFVNRAALSDSKGTICFDVADDRAYSSIRLGNKRSAGNSIEVAARTLDDYILEKAIQRIDVIKVDIEGGEMGFLRGAEKLLMDRSARPYLIMLELYDPFLENFDTSVDEVMGYLERIGYSAHVSAESGNLVPFERHMKNVRCNIFFRDDSRRHA